MQIVIDIDDMAYKFVQDTSFVEDESTMFKQTNADRKKTLLLFDILDAIQNGTPLPKGHGRLGDLGELEKRISNYVEHDVKITDDYIVARQRFIVDGIRDTPTIIEADTESEGEE